MGETSELLQTYIIFSLQNISQKIKLALYNGQIYDIHTRETSLLQCKNLFLSLTFEQKNCLIWCKMKVPEDFQMAKAGKEQ